MDNIRDLKKLQAYITLAIVVGIIAGFSSVVKNIVTERWAKSRDMVACIPSEITQAYPLVYAQTAYHPVQSDAMVKSFVEQYIHLTQDEQIINYHALSKDGRYNSVKLSEDKLKAIEMAAPESPERAMNMKKYADSQDTLQRLKKCDCGWVFLIDDILVLPDLQSGSSIAIVRGEFQVTYDRIKTELPDRLWGYREIVLQLEQGIPTQDTTDNYLNQNGIYVRWSYSRLLSSGEREKLEKRNYDYYSKGSAE